jgi:hypothetical protein
MEPFIEYGATDFLEAYRKKHGWVSLSDEEIMRASYVYVDMILLAQKEATGDTDRQ